MTPGWSATLSVRPAALCRLIPAIPPTNSLATHTDAAADPVTRARICPPSPPPQVRVRPESSEGYSLHEMSLRAHISRHVALRLVSLSAFVSRGNDSMALPVVTLTNGSRANEAPADAGNLELTMRASVFVELGKQAVSENHQQYEKKPYLTRAETDASPRTTPSSPRRPATSPRRSFTSACSWSNRLTTTSRRLNTRFI